MASAPSGTPICAPICDAARRAAAGNGRCPEAQVTVHTKATKRRSKLSGAYLAEFDKALAWPPCRPMKRQKKAESPAVGINSTRSCRRIWHRNAVPAPWRSGYAAACKAVYTGSIPVGASHEAPANRGVSPFLGELCGYQAGTNPPPDCVGLTHPPGPRPGRPDQQERIAWPPQQRRAAAPGCRPGCLSASPSR